MQSDLVRALQTRLSELGWYAGNVDGREGPLTDTGVIDFKRYVGLKPRAFVGPITLTRLFSPSAPRRPATIVGPDDQKWMVEARRLLGTREVSGSANNPVIMDWADDLDQWYPGDDVPWCGLFVAHCMRIGAPLDPQDFNRLGARNWLEYGTQVSPQVGAILVFWRGSRSGWKGHVGFYVKEDADAYHVLGGNQSNAVTITRIAKSRLIGARWPKSVDPIGSPLIIANARGELSTNEA